MRSGYAASDHRNHREEAEKACIRIPSTEVRTPEEGYMATSPIRSLATVRYRGSMRVP